MIIICLLLLNIFIINSTIYTPQESFKSYNLKKQNKTTRNSFKIYNLKRENKTIYTNINNSIFNDYINLQYFK